MTPFTLPWSNPDIDIHPDPPEGWHRVVVVGGWTDAKAIRKRWPHAAAVGPLRTTRGIDLLARALLANPQVRVVVWDGPDLTPGKMTNAELRKLFWPSRVQLGVRVGNADMVGTDIRERADELRDLIRLVDTQGGEPVADPPRHVEADRPGGAIILPPPVPTPTAPLPAGLPGQRVHGATLTAVWPDVLREVMRFGRVVPTQYGDTRELLDVVSVVESPEGVLDEVRQAYDDKGLREWWKLAIEQGGGGTTFGVSTASEEPGSPEEAEETARIRAKLAQEDQERREFKHPLLGISWADLDDYYTRSFMSATPPEGQAYGYGSRMHGWGSLLSEDRDKLAAALTAWGEWLENAGWKPPLEAAIGLDATALHAGARLTRTRQRYAEEVARYLDATAQVRVPRVNQARTTRALLARDPGTRAAYLTPWRPDEDAGKDSGQPCLVGAWFRALPRPRVCECRVIHEVNNRTREVEALSACPECGRPWPEGLHAPPPVLHLTVLFRSHDLFGAYALNLAACCRWLVEEAQRLGMTTGTVTCVSMSAHVYARDWDAARAVADANPGPVVRWDARASWRIERVANGLRATALTPDGTNVLAVYEAPTAGALALLCQRSGLLTEVGAAIWLGREIERVAGSAL